MNDIRQPLVSIVTPVHNGERYIRECIDSVLSQTYSRWNLTIVNNCSTDNTLDIVKEYAARDSRIRIHNNESFVRVMENYNTAVRQRSPESSYCKVIAADDWMFPECVGRMVALGEAHKDVAIIGAYALQGSRVVWDGLNYPSTVVPGREICRTWLLGGPYVFGTPTSLLYRTDILDSRENFFNVSNIHADAEVCLEFLEHRSFGFVHQVLTFQRVHEDSLTSMSGRLKTYLPRRLYDLTRYGPRYLSNDELADAIEKCLDDYYNFLAEQVYRGRTKEFWAFHRDKLRVLGYPLRKFRLVTAAASYAMQVASSPERAAHAVVRRVKSITSPNKE